MDGQAENYGLNNNQPVFELDIQRSREKSKDRKEETGNKKGGIKVHAQINANEGVPCYTRFTSAATHDSFMLTPEKFDSGDILAVDRAYVDINKFQELTNRGVIYVTKLKKNLKYEILDDEMYME